MNGEPTGWLEGRRQTLTINWNNFATRRLQPPENA